ncbi:MAG: glycosyltransferase family 2 protein [Patescibacteria group bacterium]
MDTAIEGKLSSVSFFCPAYHDEKNLPVLIPRVHAFLSEIAHRFEIVIVEDGSPDTTGEAADALAARYKEVRVIHHPKNLGYGGAIRDGFLNSRLDYVMYTDGDNQYDPREFEAALPLLREADVVSGYVREKAVSDLRKLQSTIFNLMVAVLFFVWIRDINCSMKIYKRKVLDAIEIKSMSAFIDAEMLVCARRAGFRIAQFPVTHFRRTEGLPSGSKLAVIVPTIMDMLKFRFGLL